MCDSIRVRVWRFDVKDDHDESTDTRSHSHQVLLFIISDFIVDDDDAIGDISK